VRIWSTDALGDRQWFGRTDGTPPWWVDETTSADADLRQARLQMSGVISEVLLDPANYRRASSLDEIAAARSLVQTAAVKLTCDPVGLFGRVIFEVAAGLQAYEHTVRRIASELLRRESIKSRRLARLLSEISPGGHRVPCPPTSER
jgi:hypothetical protein